MSERNANGVFSRSNFEWHSLVRDLVRNAYLIVIAALIGAMTVYVVGHSVYTPTYTSNATLVVSARSSSGSAYSDLNTASQMAEILSRVFTDNVLKSRVSARLGMKTFEGEMTASMLSGTNIFSLSVTSSTPEKAYLLLRTTLEIYPEISDYIFSNAVLDVLNAPKMPVSPSSNLNNAGSIRDVALLCAVAMTALILLLSYLRDTVKTEAAFKEKIDGRLLGCVPHERKNRTMKAMLARKNRSVLIDNSLAGFSFTESFHKLSTRLTYMKHNQGVNTFLVTSVTENEGKSSVAANLALSLAYRGRKVALLDADLRKPAVHKVFMNHTCTPNTVVRAPEGYKAADVKDTSLTIISHPKRCQDSAERIASEGMKQFVRDLSKHFDYVILDTPPMNVASDAEAMMAYVGASLLVVRTDYAYAADVNDALDSMTELSNAVCGCVLNDTQRQLSLGAVVGTDGYSKYGYGYGYRKSSSYRYASYAAAAKDQRAQGGERQ